MEKLSYEKPGLIRLNVVTKGQPIPTPIMPPDLPPQQNGDCAGGSNPGTTSTTNLAKCTTGATAGTTCSQGYGVY